MQNFQIITLLSVLGWLFFGVITYLIFCFCARSCLFTLYKLILFSVSGPIALYFLYCWRRRVSILRKAITFTPSNNKPNLYATRSKKPTDHRVTNQHPSGRVQRFVSSIPQRNGGWHDYLIGWLFIMCGVLTVGLGMSVFIFDCFFR